MPPPRDPPGAAAPASSDMGEAGGPQFFSCPQLASRSVCLPGAAPRMRRGPESPPPPQLPGTVRMW